MRNRRSKVVKLKDPGERYVFTQKNGAPIITFHKRWHSAVRAIGIKGRVVKRRLAMGASTFLDAYNFAKRLKNLSGPTPFDRICQLRTEQPDTFRINSLHHMAGLNI